MTPMVINAPPFLSQLISCTNKDGFTALQLAQHCSREACVHVLRQAEAVASANSTDSSASSRLAPSRDALSEQLGQLDSLDWNIGLPPPATPNHRCQRSVSSVSGASITDGRCKRTGATGMSFSKKSTHVSYSLAQKRLVI